MSAMDDGQQQLEDEAYARNAAIDQLDRDIEYAREVLDIHLADRRWFAGEAA